MNNGWLVEGQDRPNRRKADRNMQDPRDNTVGPLPELPVDAAKRRADDDRLPLGVEDEPRDNSGEVSTDNY